MGKINLRNRNETVNKSKNNKPKKTTKTQPEPNLQN